MFVHSSLFEKFFCVHLKSHCRILVAFSENGLFGITLFENVCIRQEFDTTHLDGTCLILVVFKNSSFFFTLLLKREDCRLLYSFIPERPMHICESASVYPLPSPSDLCTEHLFLQVESESSDRKDIPEEKLFLSCAQNNFLCTIFPVHQIPSNITIFLFLYKGWRILVKKL